VVRLDLDLAADFRPEQVTTEILRALSRFDIIEGETTVALAFRWRGEPLHARLFAFAQGICRGLARTIRSGKPVILMMDGDLGRTLGELLRRELEVTNDIISIDGIQLKNFDFVDIGEIIEPTHVVPLIIKSLLFPAEDLPGHG
jgi:ethanolamine utilization protein EutA